MRYRTKLIILLVTLAVITNGVLVAVSYRLSRRILIESIQSQVLSIAATAASAIDGDLHQQIKTPEDQAGPAYQTIEQQLRQIRDANRRPDVDIRYVYTMISSPDSPFGRYVVDAEEQGSENKSEVGQPVEPLSPDAQHLQIGRYVTEPLFEDKYGQWMSASAPIRDSSGKPVAAIGVDMAVSDVLSKTHTLLRGGLLALSVAVLLAIGISLFLAKFVTRSLDILSKTVQQIGSGDLNARVDLKTRDEFGRLGGALNDMAAALREKELLKGVLARYLSHQVAEKVIRSGKMPELKGERRKITVLFSDIRNFTSMADRLPPEKVVDLLNQFFERMIDVIFKHHGTLDKFTGDGLMAIFGAPLDDPDQEYHAACAALEMQHELDKLRRQWQSEGKDLIQVGIGISTGVAVVGNIGSTQRMDYTAIGDTVNLAARLESATKEHQTTILLSEQTHQGLQDRLRTTFLGKIPVKGFMQPVSAYTIQDLIHPQAA